MTAKELIKEVEQTDQAASEIENLSLGEFFASERTRELFGHMEKFRTAAPLLAKMLKRLMQNMECDCAGVCHGANADLDPEMNWCGPCIARRDLDAMAEAAK